MVVRWTSSSLLSANLTRRHLDEFQKAEVAIKFHKLFRKIARDRWTETHFISESASPTGIDQMLSSV